MDPGSVPPGRHWAWISVAGVVLYVAIDACMAVLRPDVSLLHDAESDYGNGAWSWLMDLNFLIRAVSSIAAVLAIAPLVSVSLRARVTNARPMSASRGIGETTGTTAARVGLGLIVAWTLASGLLAFLPDDLRGATVTAHGRVHLLAALVAFASIGVGTIVVSRVCRTPSIGEAPRGSSSASRSAGVVSMLLLVSTGLRERALGGLWERCFLGLELAWLLIVSLWVAVLPRVRPGPLGAAD
ncbi:MAG: DUF998 domain-containing protein [Candidatus Limnocylindrales bacterium]|nr:DUF998 domain-containing protein [Candidatus Limnocylindrales bacterium]